METNYSGLILFWLKTLGGVVCVSIFIYSIFSFFRRKNNNLINNTDSHMNEQEDKISRLRGIGIFSFIFSGIPLLIYPFVFIASIMGLAAYRAPGSLKINDVLSYMFYIFTIVYPVVYIVSCLLYFKENKRKIIFIPYIYLLICIILFLC